MGKVKLRQHDPVIAPSGWNSDEKSFVNRIEHLFDQLFQKVGTLGDKIEEFSSSSALGITEEKIEAWDNKAESSDIPDVHEWALGESKPTYTAAEVGAIPDTTQIPVVFERTATIPESESDLSAYFISVDGILATDTPIVSIDTSGMNAEAYAISVREMAKVYRIITASGGISVYSISAISSAIQIRLKVVR